MDSLVINALTEEHDELREEHQTNATTSTTIGKIGIWKGSFERQCVGVLVMNEKLQLFRKVKKDYYKVCDLTENPTDWELQDIIPDTDYSYVDYQGMILLKLHT